MTTLLQLESEWQRGPTMRWMFQRPTRVTHFEARGGSPDDRITSIQTGNIETLCTPDGEAFTISIQEAMAPRALRERAGVGDGELAIRVLPVGTMLLVRTTSASIELRPVGEQVQ